MTAAGSPHLGVSHIIERVRHFRMKRERRAFLSWVQRNFVSEVLTRLYERKTLVWLEKDLSNGVELVEPKSPVEVIVLGSPDHELAPSVQQAARAGWGDSAFTEKAFRDGGKCYVALDGNKIVSYQWVVGGPQARSQVFLGEVDVTPLLRADQFYFFKAYTFPEYRGRHLIRTLKTRAMRDFRARGFSTASTAVSASNAANLRALSRMGFAVCRIITRYRLLLILRLCAQKHVFSCKAIIRPKSGVKLW